MSGNGKDALAWWQRVWGQSGDGSVAARANVQGAPTPQTTPASTDTGVAGEVPRAARIPDPPTAGYVPGKDVLQPWTQRTYQGFAKVVPPTDAADPRSAQTGTYVDISYEGWEAKAPAPVPVDAYLIDRTQIPNHPVFTRAPVAIPQGRTYVYQ